MEGINPLIKISDRDVKCVMTGRFGLISLNYSILHVDTCMEECCVGPILFSSFHLPFVLTSIVVVLPSNSSTFATHDNAILILAGVSELALRWRACCPWCVEVGE